MTDLPEIKRYLDGDEKRHYEKNDTNVFSVTTILEEDEEPGYITGWKRKNNGKGDNADWQHILEYKQNRGTMAHYAALSQLEQHHPHSDTLWSGDEEESLNKVMDRTGDKEFLYSILKDRDMVETREAYQPVKDEIELSEVFYKDLEFFKESFAETMLNKGVTPEDVESVEHMFALPENPETGHEGYGGQADMIYEDPYNGDHVVVDLKTSKDVYDEHKKQAAAYAHAAKESPDMNGNYIDRAEIWRFNPDQEEKEVYKLEDHTEYWDDFAQLTEEAY